MSLGILEQSGTRLQEAITVFRSALEVQTQDQVPIDWAITPYNLGNALRLHGERKPDTADLQEAVLAYRTALEVFQAAGADRFITLASNNLRIAEELLATRQ